MTQTRKWVAATVAVVLVVFAAGWFFLVSPKRSEAAGLTSQQQQQQDANAALRTKLQMLRSQSQGLAEQRRRLAAATAALPDDPRLPDLVRELTGNARRAGVDLVSIAPGTPVDVVSAADASGATATPTPSPSPAAGSAAGSGSTTGATGDTGTSGAAAGVLAAVPLTLEVSGDYARLERFLNLLEGVRRPLVVTGFTLGPNEATSTASTGTAATGSVTATSAATGSEKISITGKTFMLDRSSATSATSGTTTPAP